MTREHARLELWVALFSVGCALSCASSPPAARAPGTTGSDGAPASGGSASSSASGASSDATTGASDEARHPLRDDRQPDPARALPEVSLRHIGMHVGGGTNTSEEKKPYLEAIDAERVAILGCYRFVESPLAGGTFGVDLYVPLAGGGPEVRGTRHRLGPAAFEDCMRAAFGRVRFGSQMRPTVLSYSLRFDVRDGGG